MAYSEILTKSTGVSTEANQGLTDTQKSNARANIGAGSSSLSIGTTSTTAAAGNHTHATSVSWTNGTTSGPVLNVTAGGSAQQKSTIPSATSSVSGVVTTTTQTFAGAKTFSGATTISNTTASTSKSTGALKVSGGMGVAGCCSANEIMVGDHCTLKYSNDAISFVFT